MDQVSDPTDQLFAAYRTTRARMTGLAADLSPRDLGRVVPACPLWTIFDLIAHVVSMPAAIAIGASPPGSITDWLQNLIEDRRDQSAGELTEEWLSLDLTFRTSRHRYSPPLLVSAPLGQRVRNRRHSGGGSRRPLPRLLPSG